jgi:uncharacterized LabA/DUF88 family protein/predicted RNA-binding protein with RPS1 domain
MDRAAIFIDGANVMFQQKLLGWNIDWVKFLHFINEKYRVVSARYYTALKDAPSEEQKAFHRVLATTGYSLKTKQLKKIKDPDSNDITYKGNLDIELVIDALTSIDQYDVFILLSGDSDFVPLITALRQQRKIVVAFSTKGISSIDLVSELGLDFRDISEYKSKLEHIEERREINTEPDVTKYLTKNRTSYTPNISMLPDIGDEFSGTVQAIKDYGLFLTNNFNAKVLLHIKNMNVGYISVPLERIFKIGDVIHVKIENIDTTQTVSEISVSLSDEKLQSKIISEINTIQS